MERTMKGEKEIERVCRMGRHIQNPRYVPSTYLSTLGNHLNKPTPVHLPTYEVIAVCHGPLDLSTDRAFPFVPFHSCLSIRAFHSSLPSFLPSFLPSSLLLGLQVLSPSL